MLDFSQFPTYIVKWLGYYCCCYSRYDSYVEHARKVRKDISVLISVCTWMWNFQLLDTLSLSKSQVQLIKACEVYSSSIVLNKLSDTANGGIKCTQQCVQQLQKWYDSTSMEIGKKFEQRLYILKLLAKHVIRFINIQNPIE